MNASQRLTLRIALLLTLLWDVTLLYAQTIPDGHATTNKATVVSAPVTQIAPPPTKEQSWTENPAIVTRQREPSPLFEDKDFLKKIQGQINKASVHHDKEVGFILHREDTVLIPTHIRHIQRHNSQQYVINFDGNELLYFHLSNIVNAATNAPQSFNVFSHKSKSSFYSDSEIMLSKSVKNGIMEQVVNTKGVIEANHLSVRGNNLILHTQEQQPGRLKYQNKDYLNWVLHAIEQKKRAQVSKTTPRIEWRPRKTKTGV